MAPPESSSPDRVPRDSRGKPICGADKGDGNICTVKAGTRTDHPGYGRCLAHGGSGIAGNYEAIKQQVAELGQQFYGSPQDVHPGDMLLAETRRTAGHVEWVREQITQLQGDDPNAGPSEALEDWLKIYHAERQQLIKVSKMAIDAGVQERMVSLAEQQGAMVADAIDRILSQLHLTDQQKLLIPMVVPAALRELTVHRPSPQVIELEARHVDEP